MTKLDAQNIVKKHLRMWNHRLRDVSGIAPYSFLVNGKVRVRVAVCVDGEEKMTRIASDCDVMAVVVAGKIPRRYYSAGVDVQPMGYKRFDQWKSTPSGIV